MSPKPSLIGKVKHLATIDHLRRLVEEDAGPPVGGSRRWRCPIHDGDDPNFSVYLSQSGQPRWCCHSRCSQSGSIIDYLTLARRLSTKEAVHEAARIVGAATGSGRPTRTRRLPKSPTPKPPPHKAEPVNWDRRLAAMRLVDLARIGWLDGWLNERRLTHAVLNDAGTRGCSREQYRYEDMWVNEVRLREAPEGLLLFPARDADGAVRGWQTRHPKKPEEKKARKQTASDCEVWWCGGGKPEWWPNAERVILVASPSDRLALIAAGHGHNPILAPFGDKFIRAAALHARTVWPGLPIHAVLDKDAHDKGADALAGIENVAAVGCTGSDVGEIWAKKGRLILPF